MSLIKLETFKDNNSTETQSILIASETLFKIAPLECPPPAVSPGVVPYEQLDSFGKPRRDYDTDEYPTGAPETFGSYYERTRNPHAQSVLVVRHPQGNGYTDTYYALPQTVDEIAARQPDLISLTGSPDRPAATGQNRVMTHDR